MVLWWGHHVLLWQSCCHPRHVEVSLVRAGHCGLHRLWNLLLLLLLLLLLVVLVVLVMSRGWSLELLLVLVLLNVSRWRRRVARVARQTSCSSCQTNSV